VPRLDHRGVSVTRREHDRRLAVRSAPFRISARLDQLLDHRGIAIQRCHEQRRGAFAVRRLHIGAGLDQKIGDGQVVPVHRPVERRRSVHLRGIHVDFRPQQLADRVRITFHDGVGDFAGGTARDRCRAHEQHRHRADESA
jgi:hypothetical protein